MFNHHNPDKRRSKWIKKPSVITVCSKHPIDGSLKEMPADTTQGRKNCLHLVTYWGFFPGKKNLLKLSLSICISSFNKNNIKHNFKNI